MGNKTPSQQTLSQIDKYHYNQRIETRIFYEMKIFQKQSFNNESLKTFSTSFTKVAFVLL